MTGPVFGLGSGLNLHFQAQRRVVVLGGIFCKVYRMPGPCVQHATGVSGLSSSEEVGKHLRGHGDGSALQHTLCALQGPRWGAGRRCSKFACAQPW